MGTVQQNDSNGSIATRKKKMIKKETSKKGVHIDSVSNPDRNITSMVSLIVWNISKALEKKPNMDLRCGIRAAQERLERDAREGNPGISQLPEEQHLVCALLAWQQLGHTDADSLHQFIESKKNQVLSCSTSNNNDDSDTPRTLIVASNSLNIHSSESTSSRESDSLTFGSYINGPVVKLPVDTKIVMRVDNAPARHSPKRGEGRSDSMSSKIHAACCMESACAEQLASMDAATEEQRSRAAKLAKREAERVELLERAEAAWRDLERGYQRRLSLAEEKEEDITRQIQKLLDDRRSYKEACETLAQSLKVIGSAAETERSKLSEVEREVCSRACTRLKMIEEAARAEASLAEQHCRVVQLDRDLQFKEEQSRRKLQTIESEAESARALTHEAERSLHAELGGLREQIEQVSSQLLAEDETNIRIKKELEELRQEKMGMIEDLDGCKVMCEAKMQAQIDELAKKRQQLQELKDTVIECRCKLPVDATVEVKRTASLAALCSCAPEDKILETCSCTSLRASLLSNLLADLFGGLQSELGGAGSEMPCQLLKCLEDKHNWDRSSVVKTNLRNFFSKLLVGELDIAIATSIEKYHAKWVGASCADVAKMTPGPKDDLLPGWEQRALERRAQKLAERLAEQLFEERADQLTKKAKEIITKGPPPCECGKSPNCQKAAVFPCLLETTSPFAGPRKPPSEPSQQPSETPAYWKRTHRDVTQLKLQLEDLKKDAIKREDLKLMEEKLAKIVKQAAGPENEDVVTKDIQNIPLKSNKKDTKNLKIANIDELQKQANSNKPVVTKKKPLDINNYLKKPFINEKPTKQPKKSNYHQSYAVNLCLCGPQNNKVLQNAPLKEAKSSFKQKPPKDGLAQASNVKQTKPISLNLARPSKDVTTSKFSIEPNCGSDCNCFKRVPSNTSIDKLLETLAKWKYDLGDPQEKLLNNIRSSLISKNFLGKSSKSILKNKFLNDSKVNFSTVNYMKQASESSRPHSHLDRPEENPTINFNRAVNTASLYMAAISLDKSNERINECDDENEYNKEVRLQENYKNIGNSNDFQCINSVSDDSNIPRVHKEILNAESKDFNKVNVLNEHLYRRSTNITNFNVLTNSKSTRVIEPEEIAQSLKNDLIHQSEIPQHEMNKKDLSLNEVNQTDLLLNEVNQTDLLLNEVNQTELLLNEVNQTDLLLTQVNKRDVNLSNELNQTEILIDESNQPHKLQNQVNQTDFFLNEVNKAKILPNNLDYYIKFLGVTLTDADSNKVINHSIQSENYEKSSCHTYHKENENKILPVKIPESLSKTIKQPIEETDIASHRKKKKCECNAKFEEFKNFMMNILNEQIHKKNTVQRDVGLDSQSLRYAENSFENCVCCKNSNIDNSKELEVNAFHLLEDYLKEKLKDLNTCACKSSCIPPEEEKKIFSTILKRVKQVISECTNEVKSNESGGLPASGSWERAYGLLQEYLKIKMKRVECLPFSNKNKDVVLPDILEKVCNLIENDFQRLKDICKCKKHDENVSKVTHKEHLLHFKEELPEKDTNTSKNNTKRFGKMLSKNKPIKATSILKQNISSQASNSLWQESKSCDAMVSKNSTVSILSKRNSSKLRALTQNMSSQVPPNLGMETKSCDVMDTGFENEQATETNPLTLNDGSQFIYNDCNCNYNPKKKSNEMLKLFRNKEILVNLYADVLNSNNIDKTTIVQQASLGCQSSIALKKTTKSMPNIEIKNKNKGIDDCNKQLMNCNLQTINHQPYVGCTMDCSCEANLKSCICSKSVIHKNNQNICDNWKQMTANNKDYLKKLSYIMNESKNKYTKEKCCHIDNISLSKDTPGHDLLKQDGKCEVETNAQNGEDIVLLVSKHNIMDTIHHTTSTNEKPSIVLPNNKCVDIVDIYEDSQYHISELNPSTVRLTDVTYIYETVDESEKSCQSVTTMGTANTKSLCNCDRVPLCHIKMLVDNIEQNIKESKCTCDSVSTICPIHSKRIS